MAVGTDAAAATEKGEGSMALSQELGVPVSVHDKIQNKEAEARRSSLTAVQKIVEHSHDGDEALKVLRQSGAAGEVQELDEATNRRLLRTIDWHLMPIMCIVYGLNYLDKTTLSYASIMGLKKDIGLKGDDYQWLGSLFYFGYLAWEYPTNRLLQRLPLSKYSALNVILWGTTLALHATLTNFPRAVAVRFFLGVFESAVTPGFALLTSQWYTTREQGARTGLWFSFNGFGQIFGGLVAYGINRGVTAHGSSLDSWKIVFLVNGCLTIVMGIIFYFVIPDSQLNARWLSPNDRALAVARVRINQQGIGNKHFKMYQFKEALLDPITWLFILFSFTSCIPNGGLSNFFSQLIVAMGYTSSQSLLYGAPGGAVEVIALIVSGWLGDRLGNRLLISMIGLSLALVGMIMMVAVPESKNAARLAGFYLTQASPTPFVALLSLISTNVAGYTKKTTVAALYLIAYCAGNIVGPQTFRPKDAPQYVPAKITIIVCYSVCLADILVIYWCYTRKNKAKLVVRADPSYVKLENQEFLDLTDGENPDFVYAL